MTNIFSFLVFVILLLSTLSFDVVECHFSNNNNNNNNRDGNLFGSKLWSSIKNNKCDGSFGSTKCNTDDLDLVAEFRGKLGYTPAIHHQQEEDRHCMMNFKRNLPVVMIQEQDLQKTLYKLP